jgi:hypothetical protein
MKRMILLPIFLITLVSGSLFAQTTGSPETQALPVVTGIQGNGHDGTNYCNCNTDGSALVDQNNRPASSYSLYLPSEGQTPVVPTGTGGADTPPEQ